MPQENRLDLAKFDTMAANLDLMVGPTEELELPVVSPASAIAGAVEQRVRTIRAWIGDESVLCQPRLPPVTSGDCSPPDPQVTGHTRRHRQHALIKETNLRIGDGPTDRREFRPGQGIGREKISGRDVRLGRTIVIPEMAPTESCEESPDRRGYSQLLPGHDHLPERELNMGICLCRLGEVPEHHDGEIQPLDTAALEHEQKGERIDSHLVVD